jgi:DCN1-like protein 1/2
MSSMLSALSRQQREKVSNFQAVTGAPTKLAAELLKRYNWSLDQAVDIFFSDGSHAFISRSASGPAVDAKKLDAFFRKYATEDSIKPDGIQELCNDLGVSVLDPVTLVLSWHCRAEQMGYFSREEFTGGMQRLGCDDISSLRAKVEDLRAQLRDRSTCKEVYGFTFQFALDQGQRCLPLETSVEFWKLLLREHFALLDEWLLFVEEKVKNAISRDTWMMLYDLATQLKPDLSDYDMNGAWPVVLDEFVEFVRSKKQG